MSSFVHARSFTVFPAIYVLPAANFASESAAILIRKTPLAFKMTVVDNCAADARLGSCSPLVGRAVDGGSSPDSFGAGRVTVTVEEAKRRHDLPCIGMLRASL